MTFLLAVISIHALLAESDDTWLKGSRITYVISIHALLAESDSRTKAIPAEVGDFYPRSPCGERHAWHRFTMRRDFISIHALLAESDFGRAFWPGHFF